MLKILPGTLDCFRLLISIVLITCQASVLADGERCSNCLYGASYCDAHTSDCLYGCQPGWVPPKCTTQCSARCAECIIGDNTIEECTRCDAESGMYGPMCNLLCNSNCKGEKTIDTCDHYGNCLYGCVRPYTGPRCEEQDCPFANCLKCTVNSFDHLYCAQCAGGHYWDDSQEKCIQCSIHCFDPHLKCDPISGYCRSQKCEQSWFGERCDSQCYISNCTSCGKDGTTTVCNVCSGGQYPSSDKRSCVSCVGRNCKYGDCDQTNGGCPNGCKEGWFGKGNLCDHECTFPDCAVCYINNNGNTECVTCRVGFFIKNQICLRCSENCKQVGGVSYCGKDGSCKNGCNTGFYGSSCSVSCSSHCVNNSCDNIGSCDCEPNWYGHRCDSSCPIHCLNCNSFQNGVCESCEAGWFGSACDNKCSENCHPESYSGYIYCDKVTGKCARGCSVGYFGDLCDKKCNPNCFGNNCDHDTGVCLLGCFLSYYGEKCDQECSENCATSLTVLQGWCDLDSGKCVRGCKHGYYGDYCNSSCSVNCKESRCDKVTGDCILGCRAGYTGKKCELLCKNHCPVECGPNCLHGNCNTVTKTCSSGCSPGWYGTNCHVICSADCKDRVCEQLTGRCIGECVKGKFGQECEMDCGRNCVNRSCDKIGYCTEGCIAKKYEPKYYGDDCEKRCSENCRGSSCDRQTGKCDMCGIGRHGDFCEQDCLPGTYGHNCELQCGHCKDYGPCFITDGRCPVGCEVGWTGHQCTQALMTSGSASGTSVSMKIAVGCSVAALFCCVLVVVTICWFKRKRRLKKKVTEPVVVYRDAQATIEVRQQPSSTVTWTTNLSTHSSLNSNNSTTPFLLGDMSGGSQIQLGEMIIEGQFYNIHKGVVVRGGQSEDCCLKISKLQDMPDEKTTLAWLLQTSEMLSQCGSHVNITRLITTYQNTDVYCVAIDNSIQTGLMSYLQHLSSETSLSDMNQEQNYRILQFTIDVCLAVQHIHQLKIKHRALQAGHVYLSNTLVAKVGDFDWAERETGNEHGDDQQPIMKELPDFYFPWLAPESLIRKKYTYQSDIWSLGMMFWEIFTLGRTPYEGFNPDTHRQAVIDGIRPGKPSLAHFTLYRVMKNCWRYDGEARPTPDQLLQQLLDIQGRYTDIEQIVMHV